MTDPLDPLILPLVHKSNLINNCNSNSTSITNAGFPDGIIGFLALEADTYTLRQELMEVTPQ